MIGNRNGIPFLGTCLLVSLLLAPSSNNAALTIDVAAPKVTGQKAVIEVAMKNTYAQKIESAKATMFLMDAAGKVLSQKSGWMIGEQPTGPRSLQITNPNTILSSPPEKLSAKPS